MNHYVLITKSTESDYFIDSSCDNLEVLGGRMNEINNRPNTEFSKIFKLSDIASGDLYITDQIDEICKSMSKYEFYPVHKVTTSFKLTDKISIINYIMSPSLDNLNLNEIVNGITNGLTDALRKTDAFKVFGLDGSDVSPDTIKSDIEFIGMESWIPDPIGSYYSLMNFESKIEVMESFMNYVYRHFKFKLKYSDSEGVSSIMDFQKYKEKKCYEFPIPNEVRNIKNMSDIKISRDRDKHITKIDVKKLAVNL